jgi:NADH:ubiquinone oxidoreductase subunit 6 (subunit J)
LINSLVNSLLGGANQLAAGAVDRLDTWWHQRVFAAVLMLVCAMIALAALGFAVWAAYLGLQMVIPAWAAALVMTGVLAVAALIAGSIARRESQRNVPASSAHEPIRLFEVESSLEAESGSPAALAHRLGQDLGETLAGHGVRPMHLALAALLAGVVVGATPSLRNWKDGDWHERK